MNQPATLYLPGAGPLHRLHPLTKLTLLLATLVTALWGPGFWWATAVCGALWLVGLWSGVARAWQRHLRRILLPLLAMLFLIHGLFHPDGQTPLLTLGRFAVTEEGLAYAYLLSSRLAAIVGATLLLLLTTRTGDLLTALSQRGLPPTLAYILSSTLAILPQMQTKATTIMQAQQARGLETQGTLWQRGRALLPLLAPLVLGALVESEERAMALEARAFRRRGPKSALTPLSDSRRQRVLRMALLCGTLCLLGWRLWLWYASPI